MNCALCQREAPAEMEAVIREGWVPDYYVGQQPMPGPVCPECCAKRLRLGDDGEYELLVPKSQAHRYN